MTKPLADGTKVSWTWGAHRAHGRVHRSFTRRVQRTIEGSKVVRNASRDEPAYLIEQDDGGRVLKSHSEISPHGRH